MARRGKGITPDPERLLTRSQKEDILRQRILAAGARHPFRVRYDRRFGWNFEVTKGTWATVTFSVGIGDPSFPQVVERVAQAVNQMATSTHAKRVLGERREEGEE